MTLSELFNNNYPRLKKVAKIVTSAKNVSMADDLLNSTYLVIFEKQEKGLRVPDKDDEFVKWFTRCMQNYFKWPNSSFNRLHKSKEVLSVDSGYWQNTDKGDYDYDGRIDAGAVCGRIDEVISDPDALKEIEILVEDTNAFTKELFQISSNMGEEKTLKYIELQEFKRTLPAHELILFELYYEKELSTRKIAQEYSDHENKMNYQSVNQMINKIKAKINNHQWR